MKSIQSVISHLIIFILAISIGYSQPNNTAGPAANTAGAIQNAEIPVDKFTGRANVNIPIYTVQSRGTSIPIFLSYNTSGIKVKQLGTEVGLGWNLNVGGIITRDVRGNPDEYMTWFFEPSTGCGSVNLDPGYYVKKFPESYCHNFYESTKKLYAIKGKVFQMNSGNNDYQNYDIELRDDKEADIFYLNVGAYSVKFILQNEDKIELLSPTDVKIEYFHDYREARYERSGYFETFVRHDGYNSPHEIARFVVTTPDGTKYFFDAVERLMTFSGEKQSVEDMPDIWGPEMNVNEYNSAWKLTEIRNKDNDLLATLRYVKDVQQPLNNKSINKNNSVLPLCAYNLNATIIFGQSLLYIRTPTQQLEFATTGREDMHYESNRGFNSEINNYKAKLLRKIIIHPLDNTEYKQEFTFNYSTSTKSFENNIIKRHFLSDIQLKGTRNGDSKELTLYTFGYKNGVLAHPY